MVLEATDTERGKWPNHTLQPTRCPRGWALSLPPPLSHLLKRFLGCARIRPMSDTDAGTPALLLPEVRVGVRMPNSGSSPSSPIPADSAPQEWKRLHCRISLL